LGRTCIFSRQRNIDLGAGGGDTGVDALAAGAELARDVFLARYAVLRQIGFNWNGSQRTAGRGSSGWRSR
jgi:hypothetical protein